MKQIWISLLLGLAMAGGVLGDEKAAFAPGFYVFQNGVRYPSPEEGGRALKEMGYDGIGSIFPRYLPGYKAVCDDLGLKLYSIYIGGKVSADGFQYGKEVGESIAMLKGTDALVELFVQRGDNPNDEQAVAFVREIAGLAKEAGLKVVLYPHADFHIERVDHAVRIAKATGLDNVGVAFNLCHFLKVQPDDDVVLALEEAKPLLWSVSICGADENGKDWDSLIRPLDEGDFDQAALLLCLRGVGYQGAVGLQCFGIRLPSSEMLPRSLAAWKKHLAASMIVDLP